MGESIVNPEMRFPPEILQHILRINGKPSYPKDKKFTPLWVSSYWRRTILGMPDLFNKIDIQHERGKDSEKNLSEHRYVTTSSFTRWLSWSAGAQLDVSINIGHVWPCPEPRTFETETEDIDDSIAWMILRLIMAQVERWKTFRMAGSAEHFNQVFTFLSRASSLQRLELTHALWEHTYVGPDQGPFTLHLLRGEQIPIASKSITSLVLRNVNITDLPDLSFHVMRELVLDELEVDAAPIFLRFLAQFPELEVLTLSYWTLPDLDDWKMAEPQSRLTRLRKLNVNCTSFFTETSLCWRGILQCATLDLKSLVILYRSTDAIQSTPDMSQLTELYLRLAIYQGGRDFSQTQASEWLSSLTNLQSLAIHWCQRGDEPFRLSGPLAALSVVDNKRARLCQHLTLFSLIKACVEWGEVKTLSRMRSELNGAFKVTLRKCFTLYDVEQASYGDLLEKEKDPSCFTNLAFPYDACKSRGKPDEPDENW